MYDARLRKRACLYDDDDYAPAQTDFHVYENSTARAYNNTFPAGSVLNVPITHLARTSKANVTTCCPVMNRLDKLPNVSKRPVKTTVCSVSSPTVNAINIFSISKLNRITVRRRRSTVRKYKRALAHDYILNLNITCLSCIRRVIRNACGKERLRFNMEWTHSFRQCII